jgi:hypothetical protein
LQAKRIHFGRGTSSYHSFAHFFDAPHPLWYTFFMVNEGLRHELLSMSAEDRRVREELVASNELGGPYHPRMQAVHVKNTARLRELIAEYGWPAEDLVRSDGAEAAWFITQHSVGEPEFMKRALGLVRACVEQNRVPGWHAAYLEDRIAMHEGRPQHFGTQWIDDPRDGIARPWTLAEPDQVNELRASVGLRPLGPIHPPGRDLPKETREENEAAQKWWEDWLASRGWRSSP